LVVDDSRLSLAHTSETLQAQGYTDLSTATTASQALEVLGVHGGHPPREGFDLVLLDLILPDMDGLRACRLLKNVDHLKDVPVIILTGRTDSDSLEQAFAAGAMDYISKPPGRVELLARVKSALALKAEVDRRKKRERELMDITARLSAVNQELRRLSSQDGLTGLSNRRLFDSTLDREWRRARRSGQPLALMMIDIDHFKKYNDHYGHLAGDDCLRQVARIISESLERAGDMAARYGGEEFVGLMPGTDAEGAAELAEQVRAKTARAALPHAASPISRVVTVSVGVAAVVPDPKLAPAQLVEAADQALYQAKEQGRDQVAAARDLPQPRGSRD
jgi:diguanylate cyclase (GGDEF)-like protein